MLLKCSFCVVIRAKNSVMLFFWGGGRGQGTGQQEYLEILKLCGFVSAWFHLTFAIWKEKYSTCNCPVFFSSSFPFVWVLLFCSQSRYWFREIMCCRDEEETRDRIYVNISFSPTSVSLRNGFMFWCLISEICSANLWKGLCVNIPGQGKGQAPCLADWQPARLVGEPSYF